MKKPNHFPLGNPKVFFRNARLRRLLKAGITPPTDKASLRAAAEQAAKITAHRA